MNYWLMKSEPDCFSIDHLKQALQQTTHWDGVRNYQARNMMLKQMKQGDLAFFYHSNCEPPGIAGIMKIVKEAYPDVTALDPEDQHYDPRSTTLQPRWYMVDVKYQKKFHSIITLSQLRNVPALRDMVVLRKGNRLSITPVTAEEWQTILKIES